MTPVSKDKKNYVFEGLKSKSIVLNSKFSTKNTNLDKVGNIRTVWEIFGQCWKYSDDF